MKRTVIQVFVCFLVVGGNLLIEFYPISKKYLKRHTCEINVDSILALEKITKYTSHFSIDEKKELLKIKEYQKEFCENIKNKTK